MANKLIRSNRNPIKPDKQAEISDFSKSNKETYPPKNRVASVTFDTNLKINNHIRNKLQAMAVLGYSDNQKAAIEVALSVYIESLTSDERKELEFQIDSLEKRDVRVKSK
ncbi:DUF5388 domain-containing protein [Levilactobacillus brevis]|jgi:hypothetical protein|uniref:DUF5388 domain-containing protein n=1 Tax=Levilactobacillus brevis TaxID=1580 RepID=UPI003DA1A4D9